MTLDPVDIYYFSGTGNTLLVLRKMQDIFIENGVELLYLLQVTMIMGDYLREFPYFYS